MKSDGTWSNSFQGPKAAQMKVFDMSPWIEVAGRVSLTFFRLLGNQKCHSHPKVIDVQSFLEKRGRFGEVRRNKGSSANRFGAIDESELLLWCTAINHIFAASGSK